MLQGEDISIPEAPHDSAPIKSVPAPAAKQNPSQNQTPQSRKLAREEILQPRKQIKPEDRTWDKLDFSESRKKRVILGSNEKLKYHVKGQLREDLGKILDSGQLSDIANDVAHARPGGMRPDKLNKIIKKELKDGKINKFEAKRLREEFGIRKKSSLF